MSIGRREPYGPYHDVQALVDGNAALALAKLVRERWRNGACERAPAVRPFRRSWPAGIVPDLECIDVGIAHCPANEDQDESSGMRSAVPGSVEHAERTILIEIGISRPPVSPSALGRRMRVKLEVVIIAPRISHSWLEGRPCMRARAGSCARLGTRNCATGSRSSLRGSRQVDERRTS